METKNLAIGLAVVAILALSLIFIFGRGSDVNPAREFCEGNGNEFRIEQTGEVYQEMCVFQDNQKCNAWEYMTGDCMHTPIDNPLEITPE